MCAAARLTDRSKKGTWRIGARRFSRVPVNRRSRRGAGWNLLRTRAAEVSVLTDKLYRLESVLQRRKMGRRTEAFVKWYGYPSKFSSWIDGKALVGYKK